MAERELPPGVEEVELVRYEGAVALESTDRLALEEPLEIRVAVGGAETPRAERTVAVTMRTPGADEELALGFLYAEGVIRGREEVARTFEPEDPWGKPGAASNVRVVELAGESLPELAGLERHFFSSSACGVCGRAGIENLRGRAYPPPSNRVRFAAASLLALPAALASRQGTFAATGGLHAAALFDAGGQILAVREDVGRHNAFDKLVGWGLGRGELPWREHGLLASGRASFEIVQKALAAGVALVASVSAPSSLAVTLARETGLTLVGFLRPGRFNVYSGRERIDF
ncbi:MAG TPA: formate dehydrogenase accessory sulfurtransferase FdhD [Thermoanaerobaculia bacterium]|nr:formate dehydrogenase accessory sulfurtransferase FdhD [Thermoanaerobaculia bacterium]